MLELPESVRFFTLFLAINLIVLVMGLGIEGIQLLLGRQSSWGDVYKNCLGASLAIVFNSRAPSASNLQKAPLKTVLVLLLLNALYPLAINSIDWIMARSSFPVLANFESPFERERWVGKDLRIIKLDTGNFVLEHQFDTAEYSSISLVHFPGNWLGYKCLRYRIYNPQSQKLRLIVRINDRMHVETGFAFNDRFNLDIEVAQGWNDYFLALNDIRNAPQTRSMEMTAVEEINFFTNNMASSAKLYFDTIELTNGFPNCDIQQISQLPELPSPLAEQYDFYRL